jgi:hypothetical protein
MNQWYFCCLYFIYKSIDFFSTVHIGSQYHIIFHLLFFPYFSQVIAISVILGVFLDTISPDLSPVIPRYVRTHILHVQYTSFVRHYQSIVIFTYFSVIYFPFFPSFLSSILPSSHLHSFLPHFPPHSFHFSFFPF